MNYKNLGKLLGKIMVLEGLLMLAPLLVSLIYGEGVRHTVAFLIPILILCAIGLLAQSLRPKKTSIYQKEGFALTAAVWFMMPLFGAVPLVISGDIPNFVDAFFEMTSGFTTTGASIIEDITQISRSGLFWRSFSHWIGGMGVLVFVMIFIPESNDGSSMHLLRAESPGPQVGKLVSKMKATTGILYLIYLGLTVAEVLLLLLDRPIPGYENDKFFFSLLSAFGCAGTGGFGFIPGSMELFSPFSQYVMAIFLLLFGCNFSLYYLMLLRKFKEAFRSEELKTYFIIVVSSVAIVFISLLSKWEYFSQFYTVEEAFRYSFFQVASILTTTGFSTTDFHMWPMLATSVLILLMFIGGMAGSTAGGIKISRLMIAFKGSHTNVRKLINPRSLPKTKLEGKSLDEKTVSDVFAFISLYFIILLITVFLLALDPVVGTQISVVSNMGTYTVEHGFYSNFSAALACISNIGPGFEAVGPYCSFAAFSGFSKLLLSFTMIVGRLEILPVLLLFNPRTWKKT